MSKRKIFLRLIGIGLVTAFILTSCNISVTPVAPVSMTATLVASPNPIVPTVTVTAAPAVTDTPIPTATVIETATPTAQLAAQVIPAINAYCRKGPGTGYDEITFLQQGTVYNVIGRNSLSTWWLVLAPGNVKCWMGDPNARQQGSVEQVSIIQVPPLPVTPAKFVDSYTCNTTLHTLDVVFNWSAVANVTGYRIYRNGTQITDAGPNTTASTDSRAPLGMSLVYALEAHNDYGVAARISVSVPACD